ncbi:hypothetical protein [Spiroplasma endosymbiont of Labia minor]|uniref:hypothetical protein n=1 Tax=Spiroplasma endosymbiont of Labia minor TaxID=3066305 RepID=UPI0030CF41DF
MIYSIGEVIQYKGENYIINNISQEKINENAVIYLLTIKNILTKEFLTIDSRNVQKIDVNRHRYNLRNENSEQLVANSNSNIYDQYDDETVFDMSDLIDAQPVFDLNKNDNVNDESLRQKNTNVKINDFPIEQQVNNISDLKNIISKSSQLKTIELPVVDETISNLNLIGFASEENSESENINNQNLALSQKINDYKTTNPIDEKNILKKESTLENYQQKQYKNFKPREIERTTNTLNDNSLEVLKPRINEKRVQMNYTKDNFITRPEIKIENDRQTINKNTSLKIDETIQHNTKSEPSSEVKFLNNQNKKPLETQNFISYEDDSFAMNKNNKKNLNTGNIYLSEETRSFYGEQISGDNILKNSKIYKKFRTMTKWLIVLFLLLLFSILIFFMFKIINFVLLNKTLTWKFLENITLNININNAYYYLEIIANYSLLIVSPILGLLTFLYLVAYIVQINLYQFKRIAYYQYKLAKSSKQLDSMQTFNNEISEYIIKVHINVRDLRRRVKDLDEKKADIKNENNSFTVKNQYEDFKRPN